MHRQYHSYLVAVGGAGIFQSRVPFGSLEYINFRYLGLRYHGLLKSSNFQCLGRGLRYLGFLKIHTRCIFEVLRLGYFDLLKNINFEIWGGGGGLVRVEGKEVRTRLSAPPSRRHQTKPNQIVPRKCLESETKRVAPSSVRVV